MRARTVYARLGSFIAAVALISGLTTAVDAADGPKLSAAALDAISDLSRRADAALECAVLAQASRGEVPVEEIARLGKYGIAKALLWGERMSPLFTSGDDPTGGFGTLSTILTGTDAQFWAGMAFSGSTTAVNKYLADTVPFKAGEDFQSHMLREQITAGGEFQKRNCSLIGD